MQYIRISPVTSDFCDNNELILEGFHNFCLIGPLPSDLGFLHTPLMGVWGVTKLSCRNCGHETNSGRYIHLDFCSVSCQKKFFEVFYFHQMFLWSWWNLNLCLWNSMERITDRINGCGRERNEWEKEKWEKIERRGNEREISERKRYGREISERDMGEKSERNERERNMRARLKERDM